MIRFLNGEKMDENECVDKMRSDSFYYGFLSPERVLSYSSLKLLLTSPKWFYWKINNPDNETQALRDGRLVHAAILEPEKYEKEFKFINVSSKNTKKWKLAQEEYGSHNTFTEKERNMNARITDAFLANSMCMGYMDNAETEVPWVFNRHGIPFRMKADIYRDDLVADIKTTSDSLSWFSNVVDKYDYDLQAYMYMEAFDKDEFVWLIIQKATTDVGRATCRRFDETWSKGYEKFEKACEIYNEFFIEGKYDIHQYYHDIVI